MCALATSCWSEMSKAGQSALSEAGPLEWLEMQGSVRMAAPGEVGPFGQPDVLTGVGRGGLGQGLSLQALRRVRSAPQARRAFARWCERSRPRTAPHPPHSDPMLRTTPSWPSQTRAVLCAPVGGTAPFFVVAAVPAGAAKAAARASLDSLRRSLVGPMTAVAAAMGGDMGVARRAMAEASAAATGAVRPSAAADRAGEASPEAESTGAADDVDEDDGVSP